MCLGCVWDVYASDAYAWDAYASDVYSWDMYAWYVYAWNVYTCGVCLQCVRQACTEYYLVASFICHIHSSRSTHQLLPRTSVSAYHRFSYHELSYRELSYRVAPWIVVSMSRTMCRTMCRIISRTSTYQCALTRPEDPATSILILLNYLKLIKLSVLPIQYYSV